MNMYIEVSMNTVLFVNATIDFSQNLFLVCYYFSNGLREVGPNKGL